ncbi:hypothetical protein PTKIN_Ptkin07bG0251700 [Pterospermum kingtungense]
MRNSSSSISSLKSSSSKIKKKKKHPTSRMERDQLSRRRSSCFPRCYMMSPSCFPVHEEMEYSRIDYCSSSGSDRIRRRWRNLLKRLVREGKSSIYGSKPLSFQYDAVSYSQNFDEGCHHEQSGHFRPVSQDVRWEVHE